MIAQDKGSVLVFCGSKRGSAPPHWPSPQTAESTPVPPILMTLTVSGMSVRPQALACTTKTGRTSSRPSKSSAIVAWMSSWQARRSRLASTRQPAR